MVSEWVDLELKITLTKLIAIGFNMSNLTLISELINMEINQQECEKAAREL